MWFERKTESGVLSCSTMINVRQIRSFGDFAYSKEKRFKLTSGTQRYAKSSAKFNFYEVTAPSFTRKIIKWRLKRSIIIS